MSLGSTQFWSRSGSKQSWRLHMIQWKILQQNYVFALLSRIFSHSSFFHPELPNQYLIDELINLQLHYAITDKETQFIPAIFLQSSNCNRHVIIDRLIARHLIRVSFSRPRKVKRQGEVLLTRVVLALLWDELLFRAHSKADRPGDRYTLNLDQLWAVARENRTRWSKISYEVSDASFIRIDVCASESRRSNPLLREIWRSGNFFDQAQAIIQEDHGKLLDWYEDLHGAFMRMGDKAKNPRNKKYDFNVGM